MAAAVDPGVVAVVQSIAATVGAAALLAIYHRIDQFVGRVEDNEERSQQNRELLVGDEHRDGVIDHLDLTLQEDTER